MGSCAEDAQAVIERVRCPHRATCWFFLVCGVAMALWAPMVPFAKTRLSLQEAELGLILLALGGGATVAMPVAGWLVGRVGSRIVMVAAAALAAAMLPALAVAPTTALLTVALLTFGAASGALDVSMNAHALVVERMAARPVMSGFHALFSAGGLLGSAGSAVLLQAGLSMVGAALVTTAFVAAVLIARAPWLLPHEADTSPRPTGFVLARGRVLLIGVLCAIAFLAEGAVLDWSAVFLRFSRGVSEAARALGYGAFSVAMAIGRLTGDRLVARLGPVTVVRAGALVASVGFALATLLPAPAAGLAGFVLIGVGASNVVPVLFSAAGRVPEVPASVAIAAVTTLGYAGLLAGPAIIGFAAEATSLPVALTMTGLLFVVVAVTAGSAVSRDRPRGSDGDTAAAPPPQAIG